MNSFEQRAAFRIQMPDGQKQASLRIEGRNFDVQVVDASATGVAIACPLTVALEIDDRCELLAAGGKGLIRIVRKEVFSDGILLGAERLGEMSDSGHGFIAHVGGLAAWPIHALLGSTNVVKFGLLGVVLAIVGGAAVVWYWPQLTLQVSASAHVPVETRSVELQEPTPEEVQNALKQIEALLPNFTPVVSESDQRAQRIFEQQKQLLSPETSRRLRLSPSQESQIERALKATEAASSAPSHESWEAIRRCEAQILRILTPAQVKSWRQQSGV